MPVFPATWEAEAGRSQGQDRDHPGQQGETLFVLKIQKLAGCDGACLLAQLLGRLSWDDHLSRDHATALQPGRQSETLFKKEKNLNFK